MRPAWYLQTDGYAAYKKFGKKKDITHLAYWAHARREFERALKNDPQRAKKALLMIQDLYKVERKAKEEKLSPVKVKELRLKESLAVINDMGKWIFEEIKNILPKSQIGKAMAYTYARWDALSLTDRPQSSGKRYQTRSARSQELALRWQS